MPHTTVLELLYILTGVALSYTFVGIHKVIVRFFKGERVFLPFLFICLFLPAVIWQHTYEVSLQAEILYQKYKAKPESLKLIFGLISICELISWSLLFGIIATVFPVREKIQYSLTSRKWREHVKTNRRIFFFLSCLYLCSVIYSNGLMEMDDKPLVINSARHVIMYACLGAFLLNFEVRGRLLDYNIRIVYPCFVLKNGTIAIIKRRLFLRFYRARFKNRKQARQYRKLVYNYMDGVTVFFIVIGFLIISLSRYL